MTNSSKFYTLRESSESEVCGVFPQVQNLDMGHRDNQVNYQDDWWLKYGPSYLTFKHNLSGRAKCTDFLSTSFLLWQFLLFSERFEKMLLSPKFEIGKSRFFESKVRLSKDKKPM